MTKKKKTKKVGEEAVDAVSNNKALTAEEISEKYTVKELREILRKNGLTVSGKKEELVERVLPILNDEINETSDEEVSDVDLATDDESLSSTLTNYGINYNDLTIKDETIMEDNAKINIEGFTQNGLIMSDYTMSAVSSDSSNIDLKMNIPEVSYSDFESTVFTFKNLDLSILPSADPQSLELSALMDSLDIITERDYVNLRGLNLFSKSYPDNGLCLNIGISNFLYPNFYNATLIFDDLDFNIAIGMDGQKLALTVNLPRLKIINKDYRVILSDLNINFLLHDLKLSDFDLSISIADFHYTNFDDVILYMDDINVSLVPILNSNSFDVAIGMNGFDVKGITFNDLFPMLNIDTINIKTPTTDSELPINLTGHISPLDVTKLDLTSIGALLSSGFDMDTYTRNMSGLYDGSSDIEKPGFSIGSIFKNFDYSSLDGIVLNLSDMLDLIDVDLADFGIDLSDKDLSAISLPDLIGALSNSDFSMATIKSVLNLFTLDSDKLDLSGMISFDAENFDISSLLGSLNISSEEIAGILDMLEDSDLDLGKMFENIDLSCLDGIKLNLTGLLDSIGIDLADLGIDLSDYDLSAIKVSELLEIVNNFDIDMSTISAMLKIFGLELDDIELSSLIADFDAENFDITSLLGSLNISAEDLTGILDILKNSDIDLAKIFENCDESILDSVSLNLTGLIASLGIDLTALADSDIDMPDIDLSSIKLSELIGIISNIELDIDTIATVLKLFGIDLSEVDLSGLITSFDEENFDLTSLLGSLNISDEEISGILEMFNNSDLDLSGVFENCDCSCLDAVTLNLTGLIESLDIDLADLGIDLSDYDLSSIKLSDLIGIISNSEIDFSDIASMLSSGDEPITIGEGVTDATANYYHVDCNVADVNFNEDTGKWEYQGLEIKYYNKDKHEGRLSKKEVEEHNKNCKKSGLDLSELDFSGLIASFDEENFDIASLLSSLDLSELDVSAIADMFNDLDLDLGKIFKNCDYSCLDGIVLDLTGLIASLGIDLTALAELDIDMPPIDLSAVSLSELIGILSNIELDMNTIISALKLFGIDLSELDFSGLIASFDEENFDLSALLGGLDLSGLDISGILDMLKNIGSVFENCDYSCLDAIVLNLSGIIDTLGIDLSELDIDLSDYDMTAISVSDIIDILSNFNLDMNTIIAVLKLLGIDLSELDFSGLIASFDEDNFDLSSLFSSLDLSELDLSGLKDMFSNLELDLAKIFEDCDYSCLDAIELDLTGLIEGIDIDLSALGIDVSGYDLSAISLSDIIDILTKSELIKSAVSAIMNLFNLDWDELDFSGMIVKFDVDELDISELLTSLNIPGLDISAILDMFNENGIDLSEFLKELLGMFMDNTVPELTQ